MDGEVRDTVAAGGDSAVGHFEDPLAQPRRRLLRVYRDPANGQWFAGDGRTPLAVLPGADAQPVESFLQREPELSLRVVPAG